jgi:UDP-2-acetamido-3-amino-2,3-dideoxy-glucuronate N-acetyltransferase
MISESVVLGEGVTIPQPQLVNLYGCTIGDNTKIGAFVEIQSDAVIGKNCKISSHSFICSGVTIGDGVFVGHGVMFINDLFPQAVNPDDSMRGPADWTMVPTLVEARAAIGTNATILGGVRIGEGALIGAGAVVVSDVPPGAIVAGVPARVLRYATQSVASGQSPVTSYELPVTGNQ